MERKEIKELIQPFIRMDFILMVFFSLVILFLNLWYGIACLFVVALVSVYHQKIASSKSVKALAEMRARTIAENEEITRNFVDNSPVLMCISNVQGDINWASEGFREDITDGTNLTDIVSRDNIEKFFENEKLELIVDVGEDKYCVKVSGRNESGSSTRMFYFEDVTASEIVRAKFKDSRPCYAYIIIDNYEDLLAAIPVEDQSRLVSEIESGVKEWADGFNAGFTRIKASQYAVCFEHKYIDELRANKFSIMEKIHDIKTEADFPTTISIGVGIEGQNFAQLQDFAHEALELAYGRGGDQAVIISAGGEHEYFGGGLANMERRNKGKSRIISHALIRFIGEADKVLIMGHTRPDLDAIGSSIGVAALVQALKKKAYIVLNKPDEAIDLIIDEAVKTQRFEFVGDDMAMALATPDTLLVVCDTHIGPMTECPALLDKVKKLVVIDHHRRAANAIENTVLSYLEPFASSASEQVCELIQYAGGNLEFGKFEMDAMLAGITLDTKNFTVNTGVRTFESASWLRRNGASSRNVMNFFKMRLDFFQKKVNMIASAEMIGNGFAVAYTNETDSAMAMLTGQTADELLEMRGIDAVFVAGKLNDEMSTVSARSHGQINVQVIMEKFGGGGHVNSAATQLPEAPEVAIQKIVQYLREENLI